MRAITDTRLLSVCRMQSDTLPREAIRTKLSDECHLAEDDNHG